MNNKKEIKMNSRKKKEMGRRMRKVVMRKERKTNENMRNVSEVGDRSQG